MFKIVWLTLSLATTGFSGTAISDSDQSVYSNSGEVIKMRVQGHRVDCQPGSDDVRKCYLVQKEASIGKENWEVLQQEIEGFNFEEGYTYDIIVKVEVLQDKTGPDRFKHSLVQIISKIHES
ncbi:MAG: hypothetical protein K0S23_67 [Fluviicola sp.]|jgi:hypothetical protein|uniref:DUF4377 domain-containing protein n=1 Tax=Fluviicola sp. TaxID=1917219 RepID=UPI00261FB007|nr:DUF4377 domain-containing protein [Fluviicola sp.]MDF3025760.1 hypothetical protein [Fluviicola sp.]